MPRARAGILLGTLAAVAVLAACGPAAESEATPNGTTTPAPRPSVCREDAPRYLAFLASGTCRDVKSATTQGTWVAQTLFPEAPEVLRDSACVFQWTVPAGTPAAAADIDALTQLGAEHLTRGLDGPARCEAPILPKGAASLAAPSGDDSGLSAPTGVSGCDVCAKLFGRMLFVILPPDKLDLRTVTVTTTDGQFVSFEVEIPEGTQAFSVELPSVAQERYNEGRVPLFRAAF